MKQTKLLIILFTLLSFSQLLSQDLFVRSAELRLDSSEIGGYGNVVSGVDFDGDGMMEIYAVNDNWGDGDTGELIPKIYKYENNNGTWELVWSTALPGVPLQNTWPALAAADLDKDGRSEIVWGPVNFTSAENLNPSRIVIYETVGDGSDVMGVDAGGGNYNPNASVALTDVENANIRPIKWYIQDIDSDDTDEIVFADRRVDDSEDFHLGIVSVDNVPDNGDGSEVWTIEFSEIEKGPHFSRSAVIPAPEIENGGMGNVLGGVDLDNDGNMEIYAVNDNWTDSGEELIPRMYKWEWNGAYWDLVWMTVLPGVPLQNTWPAMIADDWDGDGKGEIIWGPVNNTGTGNENPPRIVVYETAGDGSDVMGVDDGSGHYLPNASWSIVDADNANERPFRWVMGDPDGDGDKELLFGARAGNLRFGIVSVDDIPDEGDGSETFTLEASGADAGMEVAGGTIYDVAYLDDVFYLIHSSGDITPVAYDGGYMTKPIQVGLVPGGSWKTASTADIDGDSNDEIVLGQWSGGSQIHLLQYDAGGDSLTATKIGDFGPLGSSRLNGGDVGDIDGDGNLDFVFGPRTGFSEPNATVFRLAYLGGDIADSNSYAASIIDSSLMDGGQFDIVNVADVDDDGIDEVIYSGIPRSSDPPPITIIDYNDGLFGGGNKWDVAIANNVAYALDGSGNAYPVESINGEYQMKPTLSGVTGADGSFKSAATADIDGDGVEEFMTGDWVGSQIHLLQPYNGGLKSTVIADFSEEGVSRFNGGASGDIDNDGFMDFVFGTRESGGKVVRVEYRGGDITDPANYAKDVIDEGIVAGANQIDIVTLGNVDDDEDLEVVYSGIPRSIYGTDIIPIVVLDLIAVQTELIADVKVDDNGDFVPDRLDEVVTVKGVVTTPDYGGGFMSIYIQDETAGVNIYSSADPDVVPSVGQLLQVTGTVAQYMGLTELELADPNADIVVLGTGTVPEPILIIDQDPEPLEGSLIRINGITKDSGDWPGAGASANLTMSDGVDEFIMRIDGDTEISGMPEPVYPINAVGVLTQFSGSTPPDDGYQLQPRYYTDIEQDVEVAPNPKFYFTDDTRVMYDGGTLAVNTNDEQFTFTWHPAVDLNEDDLIYQFAVLVDGVSNDFGGTGDTSVVLTGSQVITAVSNENKEVQMTLRTTDLNNPVVNSVDTMHVMIDILVSIDEDSMIPKEFFVNQNYPNPFNPSTTIKFGLPQEATVDLRVYDVLGREVAVLINQEIKSAGTYNYLFNANQLASGTYIYRLQANDKIQIKKMLLLK